MFMISFKENVCVSIVLFKWWKVEYPVADWRLLTLVCLVKCCLNVSFLHSNDIKLRNRYVVGQVGVPVFKGCKSFFKLYNLRPSITETLKCW